MASNWVAAVAGITGTVLGGGLTLMNEHIRRSRDRAEKDMTLLREVSAAFLSAAMHTSDASYDVWTSRHGRTPKGRFGHIPLGDALAVEREAWPKFMSAYFTLRVVAPEDLVSAAEDMYNHIKDYSIRTMDPSIDPDQWDEDWRALRRRVVGLVREAVGADR